MDFANNIEPNWLKVLTTSGTSYLLIFAAEFGDKSQLVCMALAARYRATPVMIGSTLAFLLLNTLAVVFGATISNWIPPIVITATVAILFASFGIHALKSYEISNEESINIKNNKQLVLSVFLLITLAEFGDKTQLAIVALSSASIPSAVWIGATLALITSSALGVWAGRTLLQKIPINTLHKFSGVLFIAFAVIAAYKTIIIL